MTRATQPFTVYECFCDTVKEEMCDQIPHREIVIRSGSSNKKRRTRKLWWSDTHTTKWNILCVAEDVWIDTKPGPDKIRAKAEMKDAQRHFDRSVQSAKRRHWRQQQESSDHKAFWQQVKKLANERRQTIPWEVVHADGSVSTDKDVVLATWKEGFAGLLNTDSHSDDAANREVNEPQLGHEPSPLNTVISLSERCYGRPRRARLTDMTVSLLKC